MKNIIIIGASSAIAEEVAKLYALDNTNIYLIARNLTKLTTIQQDLKVRGAESVHIAQFQATQFDTHKALIDQAFEKLGTIDVILIAHGSLPNQEHCQNDFAQTLEEININALSVVSLLTHAASKFEQQKSGCIAAITSVAGDRGRQSNYIYGAAKSMVSTYLQGLAQRLNKSGVHVLDIKPGFVDTPMTEEFDKSALWSQPDYVAKIIKKRIFKKSSFSYVPAFWFPIMLVIKSIPDKIFNKLKL